MSDDLILTEAVYGTDLGVVGPRFLDAGECATLRSQCERLLGLTGVDALSGGDLMMVEEVAADVELATEEEMHGVGELYAAREREALLAGVKWEGGGL
jgi:hypothetical protein